MRRIITHLLYFLLLAIATPSILQIDPLPHSNSPNPTHSPLYLTILSQINLNQTSNDILRDMAVPGYARRHGYSHVAIGNWTCSGEAEGALGIWMQPSQHLAETLGDNDKESRETILSAFAAGGMKVLVNFVAPSQLQIEEGIDAGECSGKLADFIKQYHFDGINMAVSLNVSAEGESSSVAWLTAFTLSLHQAVGQMIVVHSVNSNVFTQGSYVTLDKAVGDKISYYSIHSEQNTFEGLFTLGSGSVMALVEIGIPIDKIVIAKTTQWDYQSYVPPVTLLQYFKKAHSEFGWETGVTFFPYVPHLAEDTTAVLTTRRDPVEVVSATNLDQVNRWWPPEKTAADIGVPSYAPDNMYNHFIFGTWSCRHGAHDIAKLWSQASFFLGDKFGSSHQKIQSYLKSKYHSKGKKVLVRAFGLAESPTTSKLDASVCARGLATFVKNFQLDGVDVSYRDNQAFNAMLAEDWLIEFASLLRRLLPFHTISHTIQGLYLSEGRYPGGGYQKVIAKVGNHLDFYQVVYYGQQHTNFNIFKQLIVDSGSELRGIALLQLISRGFDLEKTVIAKPVRLFDAGGAGYVEPFFLRKIFLEAHEKLGWRGGISYSNYLVDQSGHALTLLLRGMDNEQSIRLAYVNTVSKWWPPEDTLTQMGVPELAPQNGYNYFAYAFWLCGEGPQGISKVYDDPITFLGTSLGKTKEQIQSQIYSRYRRNGVKLLVSAFGATEQPATAGLSAVECGNKFVDFIGRNKLDGVDVDFEDSQSFRNGTGQQWISVFTRTVRQAHPFIIISHAPQAPYFSPPFSPRGGYCAINEQIGHHIDFYNVQFYNQMNETYSEYDSLFVESTLLNPSTALFQIVEGGVEGSKVVLGKPVAEEDAYNTGWVDSGALGEWIEQALRDPRNRGWGGGVMYWQYLSDMDGSSIANATMAEG